MKKLGIILLVLLSSLVLVSCKKDPVPTPDPQPEVDTTAPTFLDLVGGKLTKIEHLKGETVDLLDGVRARDNKDKEEDLVITVKDRGGYSTDVPGSYVLTYEVKDTSDNKATVKRDIVVHDTLDITIDAVVIGAKFKEYSMNNETAFDLEPGSDTGQNFRAQDVVHVMTKEFFLGKLDAGYVPVLPYGALALVDNDGKVQHARFSAGAAMEMDSTGEISHGAAIGWTVDVFETFTKEVMEENLPNGGHILFISPVAPQSARVFLQSSLFSSGYVGGVMYGPDQDVDIESVKVELVENHRVIIKKPDALEAPTIEINRHILTWNAITDAFGYQLYIDGEAHGNMVTGREIKMLDLELELTPEGEDGYDIEVVALTKDIYTNSNSGKSNKLVYKSIEISAQAAPELSLDGSTLTITPKDGASGTYQISYVLVGKRVVVGETDDSVVNLAEFIDFPENMEGNYVIEVISLGLNTHTDSDRASVVYEDPHVIEIMKVNGFETKVAVVTAENYFTRRNASDGSKLGSYIFKVTGVKDYEGAMNEAFSTVALISEDNKVTFVRNIFANQTYHVDATTDNKWFSDSEYKANNTQLVELDKYIKDGDSLLIGKNGINVKYNLVGSTDEVEVAARNLIAHFFVNPGADNNPAKDGWKAAMNTFVDANTLEVTFTK